MVAKNARHHIPVTGLRTSRIFASEANRSVACLRIVTACSVVNLPSLKKCSRKKSGFGLLLPCESCLKNCSSVGLNVAGSGTCIWNNSVKSSIEHGRKGLHVPPSLAVLAYSEEHLEVAWGTPDSPGFGAGRSACMTGRLPWLLQMGNLGRGERCLQIMCRSIGAGGAGTYRC